MGAIGIGALVAALACGVIAAAAGFETWRCGKEDRPPRVVKFGGHDESSFTGPPWTEPREERDDEDDGR